jgi:hypothetical protein
MNVIFQIEFCYKKIYRPTCCLFPYYSWIIILYLIYLINLKKNTNKKKKEKKKRREENKLEAGAGASWRWRQTGLNSQKSF